MSDLNVIVCLLIGLLVGAGIASAALWLPLRARLRAALSLSEDLRQRLNSSDGALMAERSRAGQLAADAARLPDALDRATRFETDVAALNEKLLDAGAREAAAIATATAKQEETNRLSNALSDAESLLKTTRKDIETMSVERVQAVADRDAAKVIAEDSREFLKNAQEQLRTAFTDAATVVFDKNATDAFSRTLNPFSTQIATFQARINELASEDATQRATLVGTIGELKTLNQEMADATNAMTKALKGNAKARGDWGEMILETVLKTSGLEEGKHFISQANSKDDDTGRRQYPDVVVTLPDGRHIVVDSKVNLVAWAEANQADTLEAQQDALIRHAAAMRVHVRDLSEKNYPKNLGSQALDTTVMFIPIEGALSAALSVNKDLQIEAWKKRVVFASPNTLMALLQVCERLWTRDKLHKQLDDIGEKAGLLIDAITYFLKEFDEVGERIKEAGNAFGAVKNRLTESKQSVLARAKKLVEAGAKGKRAIPEELQPDPGVSILDLPSVGDV